MNQIHCVHLTDVAWGLAPGDRVSMAPCPPAFTGWLQGCEALAKVQHLSILLCIPSVRSMCVCVSAGGAGWLRHPLSDLASYLRPIRTRPIFPYPPLTTWSAKNLENHVY